MKEVRILAIESSCDETAAAVVLNGREALSNCISSQIDIHTLYGGVVPEIASRKHLENINSIVDQAMRDAGTTKDDIDAIAVTYGPGLVGALVIGVAHAKALAFAWDKPLIPVHHIKGHISAAYLEHADLEPPFTAIVASGGHTDIVFVNGYDDFEVAGTTRDDAAGEAFDKVARVIGLGYPGGPKIDRAAKLGDPEKIKFKRVFLEKGSLDFSFSGIKTQVVNYVNSLRQKGIEIPVNDIAAGFQDAVVEVMVSKAIEAVEIHGSGRLVAAGGVASNSRLREKLEEECAKHGIEAYFPSKIYCTDNAAMIGAYAYHRYVEGKTAGLDLDAYANLDIEDEK